MPIPKDRRGSAGNVLAALISLFIPGAGQLCQGRLHAAALLFVGALVIWVLTLGLLGWTVHVFAALEAAAWKGPGQP